MSIYEEELCDDEEHDDEEDEDLEDDDDEDTEEEEDDMGMPRLWFGSMSLAHRTVYWAESSRTHRWIASAICATICWLAIIGLVRVLTGAVNVLTGF